MSDTLEIPTPQLPAVEVPKPTGLSRLIPQRLQALLDRTIQNKPSVPVPVKPEESVPSTEAGSTDRGSAVVALESQVKDGRPESAGEASSSPIHPDIEEGARHVLEEELEEMVRTGNTAGIEVSIRKLVQTWEQAQKAAGAAFEMTPEGSQVIPNRVREICAQHLSEGLARIYSIARYEVQQGLEFSITSEPERVAKLFQIAGKFQIPVSFLPVSEVVQPNDKAPAVLITTTEQAFAYMQEVINRNLPQGIHAIINTLELHVSQGLLRNMPNDEQRIEHWISIMEHRGWAVVDQPVNTIVKGETQPGLLPRQVNRAEIRQLLDQAVRDNLAKGARYIPGMVESNVKSGWFNPLQTWGNPENIALYTEAGERYGLTHSGGMIAENGGIDPSLYFDPKELPRHIRETVQGNLADGLTAIEARHLQNVRGGNAGQIEFAEQTLEQYIQLAQEYEVSIGPDNLRREMNAHITVDNLRQGVQARINTVRDALRRADYNGVSVCSREAEKFRQLVHNRGFDEQVDFAELDQYLKETATQAPRLTEGSS